MCLVGPSPLLGHVHHSAEVTFLRYSSYLLLDQLSLLLSAGFTVARFWIVTKSGLTSSHCAHHDAVFRLCHMSRSLLLAAVVSFQLPSEELVQAPILVSKSTTHLFYVHFIQTVLPMV